MEVAEFPLHTAGLDAVTDSLFYFLSVTSFQGLSLSHLDTSGIGLLSLFINNGFL